MKEKVKDYGYSVCVVFPMILILLFVFIGLPCMVFFSIGEEKGFRSGYIAALDDARQGKPAKYKLVQVAEKWVEVKK